MKIFQLFNQFIYAYLVIEFLKEQNKLSDSAVYHKHYCHKSFFSIFAVRLLSKIPVICGNFNHPWRRS